MSRQLLLPDDFPPHINKANDETAEIFYQLCCSIIKYYFAIKYEGELISLSTSGKLCATPNTLTIKLATKNNNVFSLLWAESLGTIQINFNLPVKPYITPLNYKFTASDYEEIYFAYIKLIQDGPID